MKEGKLVKYHIQCR